MIYKSYVLVLCILYTVQLGYGYSDCGSVVGNITSLSVEGCDNDDSSCVLKRGSNVTIEINFMANEKTDEVKAIVHGVILGVPVPFALPNGNACEDAGITCPIEPGKSYSYKATLPVLRKYPRVTVDVKWELQDKNEKDIVCAYIPSKIQ